MDKMISFDAILFPADERAPHLVSLMMSNTSSLLLLGQPGSHQPPSAMAKVPHPEMYMDFIAEGVGVRPWQHHVSSHFLKFFACFHPSSAFLFFPHSNLFAFLVTFLVRFRSVWAMITLFHIFAFPPRFALPDSPNANQTNLTPFLFFPI